jgi:CheY-like chemotaxis protein/anti-sigma regulatory factor (Ser/Thr protein kinase)
VLLGDDLRVKRIFNNLLSNACKYTETGSVTWRIDFEVDGDTVWIISDIIDTGVGIKPEDKEKLFGVYSQVNTQANRNIEGTGLGLSIMKNLLDMMDGTIVVESEYGKGSQFSIRFRQGFVSDVAIGKKMAENLMSERYTASKLARRANIVYVDMPYASVLVVDDVNTNLDVVKGMLKPYGLRVDTATSGKQAIEMIRSEKPRYDAIFMDHMMPGMDGVEATNIIREELGTEYARTIPIIALTANAVVGSEQMFLDNGFQAFISKPIDILILDSVLRKWVRDKTRERGFDAMADHDVAGDRGAAEQGEQLFCGPQKAPCDAEDLVIEGVDVRAGVANFGNDVDMYVTVLSTFSKNTRNMLTEIDEHLAKVDLKDYSIEVHGIKGSAYNIFATELGDRAKRLENLAKAGEEALVRAENRDFVEYVNDALDTIDEALVAFREKYAKPRALAPDTELFEKLREACGRYDVRQVDAAMQALESYEYETGNELVNWLREQVDDMNFDEIYKGDWQESFK